MFISLCLRARPTPKASSEEEETPLLQVEEFVFESGYVNSGDHREFQGTGILKTSPKMPNLADVDQCAH